jgi:hypothetical protein
MRKIMIIAFLAIGMIANAQVGFTSYNEPAQAPTTQELIASMSPAQRTAIVGAFANEITITNAKHSLGLSTAVVTYFYTYFKQIDTRADELMRENDFNSSQLIDAIHAEFSSDFTENQIEHILTVKVEWSDGSDDSVTDASDWAYYKSKF